MTESTYAMAVISAQEVKRMESELTARADRIAALEAENARLRERIGKLEVFLLSIEWQLDPEAGGEYCPACKMNKRAGHRDCLLAALLTEER